MIFQSHESRVIHNAMMFKKARRTRFLLLYSWGPQNLDPYSDVYLPVVAVCLTISTENNGEYLFALRMSFEIPRGILPILLPSNHVNCRIDNGIWWFPILTQPLIMLALLLNFHHVQSRPCFAGLSLVHPFVIQHCLGHTCSTSHIQQFFDARHPNLRLLRSQSGK